MKKVLVSACLAGFPCRYDGRAKPVGEYAAWVKQGKAIAVCPEQLGGLATPRARCEIRQGRVVDENGADRTAAFMRGAAACVDIARRQGITRAYLKQKSPSCGAGCIYDGSFCGKTIQGNGIAACALKAAGIEVIPVD
nr:DUF523 domain-containing protein [bacterium]